MYVEIQTYDVIEFFYPLNTDKLYSKGIKRDVLEDYVSEHIDELEEYEKQSAQNIINKKIHNTEKEDIINYLLRKGYKRDNIKIEE